MNMKEICVEPGGRKQRVTPHWKRILNAGYARSVADGTVQRDLCNDTCFKSAYLFKNILENNQDLNGMGYFTLNDRIDEVPPSADTFHGGFGLFTKTIFPKAPVGQWSFSARWETDFFAEGRGIISPDLKKRYRSFSIITAIMIFYTVTGMWLI